jgi:glycosyltransferase involved in cell wall biosynthesis
VETPRILFVDHAGVLGGAELYLLDIARHYRDHATVVLFEEGPFYDRLTHAGVAVKVLSAAQGFQGVPKTAPLWQGLRALPGWASLCTALTAEARRHDLVFANSQKALMAAGPAAWWSGRPFVWNLHDILTADHFSRTNRRAAAWMANAFADRIIVNSRATRSAFVQYGGAADRCAVVYNGLDPDRFASFPDGARRKLRAQLGLPDDVRTVGVFSRLAPWKGQHVLLDSLSELPDVHALFVGDALFDGDVSYAETLRTRAAQRGVADRAHFLGFRDDVPALMQLVDVVAHTSTAPEPFGRVIVEGMLAQTPVVATRGGGPSEIIDDGRTGFLVPPADPKALATTLRSILDRAYPIRPLTEAARTEAVTRFSTDTLLARIDAVLDPFLSL